ncbi:hypothetical protein HMN09_00662900 [Mycena chlorophos]|uniref:Uncharacterized protein n=1 Tax=Mycena chlorophos TaxID=658473 RepID=A0A8H6T0I7_MYCCL|nr:hypothetical protein HMN09_00662900 [Mycena chlorophos]
MSRKALLRPRTFALGQYPLYAADDTHRDDDLLCASRSRVCWDEHAGPEVDGRRDEGAGQVLAVPRVVCRGVLDRAFPTTIFVPGLSEGCSPFAPTTAGRLGEGDDANAPRHGYGRPTDAQSKVDGQSGVWAATSTSVIREITCSRQINPSHISPWILVPQS